MYTNRYRALSRIHRAIQAGMPVFRTDGGEGTGGPATPPAPAPQPPAPKPGEKPPEPEKISLTAEELSAKINSALADAQKKADDKAAKDKADAERKAAEEQGEFKKIADAEKTRADAAEAKVKASERREALRDYLTEKHPDYASVAKYILPLIPADVEGEALTKSIAQIASDYVKDNPRTQKGSVGAPPAQRQGTVLPPATNGTGKPSLSPITRGF